MINALWYPPNSSSSDVRLWDANGQLTPRAHGDYNGNTATSYGLMLAYNQFSSNTALQGAGLGGFGRVGAQRIVIVETDGMANTATSCGTCNAGAYQSYYQIRPGDAVTASGADAAQDALDVATRICALTTDANGIPGYATARTPVLIHLAFGAVFEPTASGSEPASRRRLLCRISPQSAAPYFPIPPATRITATNGASARFPSGKTSSSKRSRRS